MAESQLFQQIEAIKRALNTSGREAITGANLWELIKDVAPGLDVRSVVDKPTGPGALSRFVDDHLHDVLTRGGKRGSDPVYTIAATSLLSPTARSISPETSRYWAAFVRSGSPTTIVLTEDPPYMEVVDAIEAADTRQQVKAATFEELDKIRADYTQILSDKLGESKGQIPNADAPFADWSAAVRRLGAEHYKNWAVYRVERILELFVSRLRELHVDEPRIAELERALRRAQSAARLETIKHAMPLRSAPPTSLPPVSAVAEPGGEGEAASDEKLRSAIAAVVGSLPMSDLRDLWLPVGLFWDVVNNLTRKN